MDRRRAVRKRRHDGLGVEIGVGCEEISLPGQIVGDDHNLGPAQILATNVGIFLGGRQGSGKFNCEGPRHSADDQNGVRVRLTAVEIQQNIAARTSRFESQFGRGNLRLRLRVDLIVIGVRAIATCPEYYCHLPVFIVLL